MATDFEIARIKRFRLILMLVWCGMMAALTGWMLVDHNASLEALNLMHARSYFERDLAYRHWNAARGGVYAPVDELTPPNPYLDLPHRDVTTTSGRKLTLINPAYMTRQVHELIAQQKGVLGHITSLNPIRPENFADPWESETLNTFDQGVEEISAVSKIGGIPYLRLMRPLITEQACLTCHEVQGYKVGDIRGGISISIPYSPIAAIKRIHNLGLIGGNLGFWLLGLFGIYLGTGGLLKGAQQRQQIERQLRNSEAKATHERYLAQQYFNLAGVLMVVLDREGKIRSLNQRASEVLGVDVEAARGLNWFQEFLPEASREEVLEIHRQMIAGTPLVAEHYENMVRSCNGGERLIAWHNAVIKDDDGEIIASLSSGEDITDQRQLQSALATSERRLRTVIESEADGVLVLNSDDVIAFINPAAERLLMRSREQLLGKPFGYPLSTGKTVQLDLIRPDGNTAAVAMRVVHTEWEGGAARVVSLHDITGRLLIEEERIQHACRLQSNLVDTIQAVAMAVEKRDPYTAGHQRRVADLSAAIATEMGLDEDHILGIRLGGMIHDVGKIYVPAEVLNRPGKLSDSEFNLIKNHPDIGYEIIADVQFDWPIADIVRQHHERLDGSGYPQGLKGDEIALEARIIAVADVVEAMASHRPYRPAKPLDSALEEIEINKRRLYDAEVVDACLRLFREKSFEMQNINSFER
ncbi:MAG: HD domain-containing phosphohydrolase [Sedimenticola sp.]